VKIAQIEAEAKIRLAEMETERVELIKQAQMELLRDEAEAKILVEEAKAKGFTVMAQTIMAMQEQLTQITNNRIEIIAIKKTRFWVFFILNLLFLFCAFTSQRFLVISK
jgi:hypothetical protein